MRSFSVVVAAILALGATPSMAGEGYRAGYEIILRIDKGEWQVRARSPLSAAQPIRHEFGKYEVSIALGTVSESAYLITVTVTESGASRLQGKLLEHSFEGTFNGVLEFASDNDLADVAGAIAVSPIG